MKIGVTGAAGFLGSSLAIELLRLDHSVVAIDNLSQGVVENLDEVRDHPRLRFEVIDTRDYDSIHQAFRGCQIIVHLAAKKIPRYGGTADVLEVNAFGSWNVFRAALDIGSRVIVASTSDVYGKNPSPPFHEDSEIVLGQPSVRRWAYATSKLFDEHALFAFVESGLVDGTAIRFFGGYGPGQALDWHGGPVPVFINAALDNRPIEIHGSGDQTRTFTFVDDHVSGIAAILSTPTEGARILNLGTSDEYSIRTLAIMIWEMIRPGSEIQMQQIPYATFGRYEDVVRRVPDTSLVKHAYGWRPSIDLETGLRRTIAWQIRRRRSLGQVTEVDLEVLARLADG